MPASLRAVILIHEGGDRLDEVPRFGQRAGEPD
jgi:hypothetical protein